MAELTDRELLERAAKAAGIAGFWVDSGLNIGTDAEPVIWNPLTDDGDALRLAVKRRFDICTEDNDPHPTEDRNISHVNVWPFNGGTGASEDLEGDPYAATRRAIVRAAASLVQPQQTTKEGEQNG